MDTVKIFDTTLRDGEQSPGISLDVAEKLEIADQLARLGVDIIEAGFPIASDGDFESVEAIAKSVRGPVIAVPSSVGYGASFGGLAALLTMLNSCAAGVTVCNIDNGFGAAVAAYRVLSA